MTDFRFRPFPNLRSLQREMNQMFESVFRPLEREYPACNIWSGEEDLLLTCELPGIELDDLDITVMADSINIAGERKTQEDVQTSSYHRHERDAGKFSRTIGLPIRIDTDKIDAEMANGVLKIRMPKASEEKPRKIEIKS